MGYLKRLILKLDERILNKRILNARIKNHEDKLIKKIKKDFLYEFTTYYQKNLGNELSILCDVYGSDKGETGKKR